MFWIICLSLPFAIKAAYVSEVLTCGTKRYNPIQLKINDNAIIEFRTNISVETDSQRKNKLSAYWRLQKLPIANSDFYEYDHLQRFKLDFAKSTNQLIILNIKKVTIFDTAKYKIINDRLNIKCDMRLFVAESDKTDFVPQKHTEISVPSSLSNMTLPCIMNRYKENNEFNRNNLQVIGADWSMFDPLEGVNISKFSSFVTCIHKINNNSITFKIQFHEPFENEVVFEQPIQPLLGSSMKLSCTMRNKPPDVYLQIEKLIDNSNSIKNPNRIDTGALEVKAMEESDSGIYECTAYRIVGSIPYRLIDIPVKRVNISLPSTKGYFEIVQISERKINAKVGEKLKLSVTGHVLPKNFVYEHERTWTLVQNTRNGPKTTILKEEPAINLSPPGQSIYLFQHKKDYLTAEDSGNYLLNLTILDYWVLYNWTVIVESTKSMAISVSPQGFPVDQNQWFLNGTLVNVICTLVGLPVEEVYLISNEFGGNENRSTSVSRKEYYNGCDFIFSNVLLSKMNDHFRCSTKNDKIKATLNPLFYSIEYRKNNQRMLNFNRTIYNTEDVLIRVVHPIHNKFGWYKSNSNERSHLENGIYHKEETETNWRIRNGTTGKFFFGLSGNFSDAVHVVTIAEAPKCIHELVEVADFKMGKSLSCCELQNVLIIWELDGIRKDNWENQSSIRIFDSGNYTCTAYHDAGVYLVHFYATREYDKMKMPKVGAFIFAGLIVLGIVYKYANTTRSKREYQKQLDYMFNELRNGRLPLEEDDSHDQKVQQGGLDEKFELDPKRLRVDYRTKLGNGNFGEVHKGDLYRNSFDRYNPLAPKYEVVVKSATIKKNETLNKKLENLRSLMEETKILANIGSHPNIIKFVGCKTKGFKRHGLLELVLEYCEKGDLKNYLVKYREAYEEAFLNNQEETSVKKSDLLSFSFQIANGMHYLSSIRCYHRDLQARNVLLTARNVVRITDFGLARKSQDAGKQYYRTNKDEEMPSALFTPEIIECSTDQYYYNRAGQQYYYNQATEIWSFGVIMWEIFTLGGTPYKNFCQDYLFSFIRSGKRLEKPQHCSIQLYELMRKCWDADSSKRPNFAYCKSYLSDYINHKHPKLLTNIVCALGEEKRKQAELEEFALRHPTTWSRRISSLCCARRRHRSSNFKKEANLSEFDERESVSAETVVMETIPLLTVSTSRSTDASELINPMIETSFQTTQPPPLPPRKFENQYHTYPREKDTKNRLTL